jgi:hypothetical protein
MRWFPLDLLDSRSLVDTWKSRPDMLGRRFYFNQPHEQSWPTDGMLDWLWPAADQAGGSISLAAATFLPVVGQIAERHPGLKLIIDHLGVPRASNGEESYQYQPQLLALARDPNIAVKPTGQAGYATDDYPFPSIHPARTRSVRARTDVPGHGHYSYGLRIGWKVPSARPDGFNLKTATSTGKAHHHGIRRFDLLH